MEILGNTATIYIVTGKHEKGTTTSVDEILDQVTDEEAQKFR